jgi:hypothetical protein
LLIGIFVLYRSALVLLIGQSLLNLCEIEAIGCLFQKSFGRFFQNYFLNLHLCHARQV